VGLAVRFLYLDYYEPIDLPDGAPGLRPLRLVPRSDDPKLGRTVVNFVLFGPGYLDDRGAVGSPAFAAPRSKCVEAVLTRLLVCHARKLPERCPPPFSKRSGFNPGPSNPTPLKVLAAQSHERRSGGRTRRRRSTPSD
jgi:hypothetical protein